MFNIKTLFSLCVFFLFIGYMVGVNINYIFPPKSLSDEEIYNELLIEWEHYMKVGGIWDKKVSDVPIHISNNKDRIYFEIERFRGIACNETN